MARSLHRHLTKLLSPTTTSTLLRRRYKSTQPDYAATPRPRQEEGDEKAALRRLEEAVHRVIVKKAQPDWIPLVPGGSYWVPPRESSRGFAQVVANLVKHSTPNDSNKEGVRVWNSSRGWPSSAHFFIGSSHTPLEGEMTFKRSKKSEDEEG